MMYDAYQGLADVGDRVRMLAGNAQLVLEAWASQPFAAPWRKMAAYYEVVALAGFTHARPDWDIDAIEIGERPLRDRTGCRDRDAVLRTAPFSPRGRARTIRKCC